MINSGLRSIVTLSLIKLVSSLLGLVYSVLQVRYFGADGSMDAFFVAVTGVYVLISIVQSGQLSEVYLPEYVKLKSNASLIDAHILFSVLINRVLLFTSLLSILAYVGAPLVIGILGVGLESSDQSLAIEIFRVSAVLLVFAVFSAFVNTTLLAEQIFGRAEVTGLINSAVSLILILSFHQTFGVWILVYALLIGKIVELATGILFLRKAKVRYSFVFNIKDYDLSKFLNVLLVTSGYVGSTQLYTAVLTASASLLAPGTLSLFNYVKQLSIKAAGIIFNPVNTVFFSKFSSKVADSKANLSSYFAKPLLALGIISITILISVVFLGNELLLLLWSEKALSQGEYNFAYWLLVLNFLGICFSSVGGIFRKGAISLGNAKLLYGRWIMVQLFSALYAFVVIRVLGVYGLATILPVNMVLMSLVSTSTALSSGISIQFILSALRDKLKYYLILVIILIVAAIVAQVGFLSTHTYLEDLGYKMAILSFVLVAYFSYTFSKLKGYFLRVI